MGKLTNRNSRLQSRSNRNSRKAKAAKSLNLEHKLRLESLEDRIVPSGNNLKPPVIDHNIAVVDPGQSSFSTKIASGSAGHEHVYNSSTYTRGKHPVTPLVTRHYVNGAPQDPSGTTKVPGHHQQVGVGVKGSHTRLTHSKANVTHGEGDGDGGHDILYVGKNGQVTTDPNPQPSSAHVTTSTGDPRILVNPPGNNGNTVVNPDGTGLTGPDKGTTVGFTPLGHHPLGNITLGSSFEGLNYNDTSCGCLPPDNSLAVGNGSLTGGITYVMEGVNTAIRIADTTGHTYSTEEESTFFSSLGQGAFGDPQIVYDDISNRWIVENFTGSFGGLEFAVSNDANPLHGFSNFQFLNLGFPDFAKVGYNANNIFISFDEFNAYKAEELVIDKASFYSGGFNYAIYSLGRLVSENFDVFPARMHGAAPGNIEWLASETSFDAGGTNGGGKSLRIWQATGTNYNSLTFTPTDVPVNNIYGPAKPVDQPGAPGSGDADYSFIVSVDWRNGELVTAHHGTFAGDGYVADKAVWDLYNAPAGGGSPTLMDEGVIDPGMGVDTYYPAAALDSAGDVGITYMESSVSEYISMYVGVHGTGDAKGTTTTQLVRTDKTFMPQSFRLGDYSAATVDAGNPSEFWMDSEYSPANANSEIWATYVASFNAALAVVSSDPAANSIVNTQPTTFVINWSSPVVEASVLPADFTVTNNNTTTAADSVSFSNGDLTTTFTFNSTPVTHEGLATMAIPAGVIQRQSDGSTNAAFNANFRYDPSPMTVTATDPANGQVVNMSGTTEDLIVTFSEPYGSISTSNLTVSLGTVTAATPVDATHVDYTISNINSEGTVSYSLSGETDADGNPAVPYSGSFIANILISPYPTPLSAKKPLGSLIYDPSVSAGIQFSGDTDSFTINLNAGQTLTVDVTTDPSLQGSVQVTDPNGNTVGYLEAGSAGQELVLQTVPVTTAGTYTVTVSDNTNGVPNGTTGNFTMQLTLNSALDSQEHGGASNGTLGTAQSLDSSFISLGLGGASRGAVLGATHNPTVGNNDVFVVARGSEMVVQYDSNGNQVNSWSIATNGGYANGLELGANNDLYVGVSVYPYNTGFLDHYSDGGTLLGQINVGSDSGSGYFYPFGFDISPVDGTIWLAGPNSGNIYHLDANGNPLATYATGIANPEAVQVGPDGGVYFGSGYFYSNIYRLDSGSGAVTPFANDFGYPVIGVKWSPDNTMWAASYYGYLFHYDSSGNYLGDIYDGGSDTVAQADLNQPLANVWDTNFYGAVYKHDASGNLLLSVGASEPVGLSVAGSDMPLQNQSTVNQHWYSFTLNAGESASIVEKGDPGVSESLYDSSGNLLAIGAAGSGRVDQDIKSFVNTTGSTQTYYIWITGAGRGTANYSVVVTKDADFGYGGTGQISSAQSLDGTGTVLGAISKGSGGLFSQIWEGNLPLPIHATDPTTGQFTNTVNMNAGVVTNPFGENLAFDGTYLWYNDGGYFGDNNIYKIDPNTGNVLSVITPQEPYYLFGIAYLNGAIYATDFIDIWVINPNDGSIENEFANVFNGYTLGLTADPAHDTLWAVSQLDFNTGTSMLYQIDPNTGTILQAAHDNPTSYEQDIAYANDQLYVSETYSPGVRNGISVYNADTLAFVQHFDTTSQLNSQEMMAGMGGDGLGGQDLQYYSFNANAGDSLTITGSAFNSSENGNQGEFQNGLSPVLYLYDSNGNQVGSAVDNGSGTAVLNYSVSTSGTYYAEIASQNKTYGEFVLNVTGNTGAQTPFTVTNAVGPNEYLTNGNQYYRSISQMTVTFSESVNHNSLADSNFSITTDTTGGTPENATSFVQNDDHTVTYYFNALPVGNEDGVAHYVSVTGVQDLQGDTLVPFNQTIYLDNVPPSVVSVSILGSDGNTYAPGSFIPTGTTEEIVTFSETMNTSFTTASSFALQGVYRGVSYSSASFSWDVTGTVLTITYSNLPDDLYSATLYQSGFEDGVDLQLSSDYTFGYKADIDITGTANFPTPVQLVGPAGSLVYQGTTTAVISNINAPPDDMDTWNINLNAGQTMSIVVTPLTGTMAPTIDVYDPNGNYIDTSPLTPAGQATFVNSDAINTAGVWQIVIGGGGTEGLYKLQIILNAQVKLENFPVTGLSDETPATAQPLDFSAGNENGAVSLGNGETQYAVTGTITGPGVHPGNVYASVRGTGIQILDNNGNLLRTINDSHLSAGVIQQIETGPNNDLFVAVSVSPYNTGFLAHYSLSGQFLGEVNLPTDGGFASFYYPFGFDVAADGTIWVAQPNTGNVIHVDASGNLLASYSTGLYDPEAVAVGPDGNVYISVPNYFAVYQLNPTTGAVNYFVYGGYTLGLSWDNSGNLWVGDADGGMYEYAINGSLLNQIFPSASVTQVSGDVDTSGNPTTNAWNSNFYQYNFVQSSVEKFDQFGNLLDATGNPLFTTLGMTVGGVEHPVQSTQDDLVDYYSINLNQGESITAAIKGISGGTGVIDIEDGSGNVLAIGNTTATNVDQSIENFVARSGGTYYIKVSGKAGLTYNLVVTKDADFNLTPNSTMATAQDITATVNNPYGTTGGGGALGTLQAGGGVSVGSHFQGLTFNDTSCGCLPPDNALAVGTAVNGVTYVMEGVNTAIRITDTNGNIYSTEELSTFFSSLGQGAGGDPQIVFDDIADRWIVENFTGSFGGLEIAVSNDANPIDGFENFNAVTLGFPDFAKVGFNADEIFVSYDEFNSYQAQELVIDKASFYANTGFNYKIYTVGPFSTDFDVFPAREHGVSSGAPEYFAEESSSNFGSALRIWQASGLHYNSLTFTSTDVPVTATYSEPIAADQPGAPGSGATDSSFVISVDWRNGELVTAHHGSSVSTATSGDKAIVDEFNAPLGGTPTLNQEIVVDPGAGVDTYYPAAAINANGDIGITYMESSTSEYISMYETIQAAGAPAGTYSTPVDVAPGQSTMPYAFRLGDYSTALTDPNDNTSFWASSEFAPQDSGSDIWATYTAEFSATSSVPQQWYSVNANAGDNLAIIANGFNSNELGQNPGEFENVADPTINLYDANGNLLASGDGSDEGPGGPETIDFSVSTTGTYYIQVEAEEGNNGEYTLSVQGSTAEPNPFTVTSANPADGALIKPPPSITVTFSASLYSPSTVSPTSLTISGMTSGTETATAVTVVNDHTLIYTLPQDFPASDDSPHTITVSGLTDISGGTLVTYTENITVDNLVPTVVSVVPVEGAVLNDGSTVAYVVTFSEDMNPSATNTSSFDLHGDLRGVDYASASDVWSAGNTVLTITYNNLPDDQYTMTLFSAGFQDDVGYFLNGVGDGTGANFTSDFTVDNPGPFNYPTPLSGKNPLGSLIYDPSVTGVLAPAGDSDSYTINLNAGQVATVVMTSKTLEGSISLVDPNGVTQGTVNGTSVGQEVILQNVPIATAGIWTINISDATNTNLGLYNVQLILNAQVEDPSVDNSTLGSAVDISGSSVNLGNSMDRLAVIGHLNGAGFGNNDVFVVARGSNTVVLLDPNGNQLNSFPINNQGGIANFVELGANNDLYIGVSVSPFNTGFLDHYTDSGTLLGTVNIGSDGGFASYFYPFGFDISPVDGSIWLAGPNTGNVYHYDANGNLLNTYATGIGNPETVQVGPDGGVYFGSGYGYSNVYRLDPGTGNVTPFAYVFNLPVIGIKWSPDNTMYATSYYGYMLHYDQFGNFLGDIYDGGSDTVAQADLNGNVWSTNFFGNVNEYNSSGGFLNSISENQPVGLSVTGSDMPVTPSGNDFTDYYSFNLTAGEQATIVLTGTGSNLGLQLQDGSGNDLADGVGGAPNVNLSINNFTATYTGTYYVRATATSKADYNIVVTRNATFDQQEAGVGGVQDITGNGGALGTIIGHAGAQIGSSFEGTDFNGSSCGCLPPDTNAAVGNGFVSEAVNVQFRVFDTSGNILLDEPLSSLFGASTGGDPYVLYDDIANRWYISAFDSSDSGLFLAVSNDSSPLDGFKTYDLTNVGGFPDYNKPGFNFDAIFIGFNDFGSGGGAATIATINKADLFSGTLTYYVSHPESQFRAMPPAQLHGDT
jgi:hypothetical protein